MKLPLETIAKKYSWVMSGEYRLLPWAKDMLDETKKKDAPWSYFVEGGRASCITTQTMFVMLEAIYPRKNVCGIVLSKHMKDTWENLLFCAGEFHKKGEDLGEGKYKGYGCDVDFGGKALYYGNKTIDVMDADGYYVSELLKSLNLDKPRIVMFDNIHEWEKDEYEGLMNLLAPKMAFHTFNSPSGYVRDWIVDEVMKQKAYCSSGHTYMEVPKNWIGEKCIAQAEQLKAQNVEAYAKEYGFLFVNGEAVTPPEG